MVEQQNGEANIEQKQQYLVKTIMQTAYDTDEFAEFMCSIRGNDINSYTYADVIQVSGG